MYLRSFFCCKLANVANYLFLPQKLRLWIWFDKYQVYFNSLPSSFCRQLYVRPVIINHIPLHLKPGKAHILETRHRGQLSSSSFWNYLMRRSSFSTFVRLKAFLDLKVFFRRDCRGEREFPFSSIPGNESLWFLFPNYGSRFFHSLPVPEFLECYFFISIPFPNFGHGDKHPNTWPSGWS